MPEPVRALRRSPLAHRGPISAPDQAVQLAEQAFLGKFILRADRNEAAERLRSALPIGLPFDALTSSAEGETALLWMGPDEWMLVTAPEAAAEVSSRAIAALAGTHHQLVDVSDYYTAVDIAGPRARELLMKLTTLDLHPRAFRAGMVTGSVFGRANATIWLMTDEGTAGTEVFRIFVRWSMADYLWCVLAECGREWGLPAQVPVKGEQLTLE